MTPPPTRLAPSELVIVAGLAAGAVFGIAGTMVADAPVRQVFWGIDGVGLVVATTLLAIRALRAGHDMMAAGFLVFALGEAVLVSGNPAGLAAAVPSFGGGVALWAAGLLMVSGPAVLPGWVRAAGVVAAVLFTVVAVRIHQGEALVATAAPLPSLAYPPLVLTFVGWIVALLQRR
jgi:hypothetical protein